MRPGTVGVCGDVNIVPINIFDQQSHRRFQLVYALFDVHRRNDVVGLRAYLWCVVWWCDAAAASATQTTDYERCYGCRKQHGCCDGRHFDDFDVETETTPIARY